MDRKSIKLLIIRFFILIGLMTIKSELIFSQGVLKFDTTLINFGKIDNKNDTLSGVFLFCNNGDKPIIIEKIRASCDCTNIKWTKGEILPGMYGQIKVAYHVEPRAGEFYKSITVFSNAVGREQELAFMGEIKDNAKSIEKEYSHSIGNILITTRILNFGEVTQGEDIQIKFNLYNNDSIPIFISKIKNPFSFCHATLSDEIIFPGASVTGIVKCSLSKKQKKGQKKGMMEITLSNNTLIKIDSKVNVLPERSFAPTEIKNGFCVKAQKTTHSFGDIAAGSIVATSFSIENISNETLKLELGEITSPDISARFTKKKLRPGECADLSITFDTNGKSGRWSESISVYTNATSNQEIRFVINMNIIQPL